MSKEKRTNPAVAVRFGAVNSPAQYPDMHYDTPMCSTCYQVCVYCGITRAKLARVRATTLVMSWYSL